MRCFAPHSSFLSGSAARTSLTLPGVGLSENGRPIRSVRMCGLVICPPRDGPMPCVSTPFSAKGRALCLYVSAVDRCTFCYRTCCRQRFKHPGPKSFSKPNIEPIINTRVRTIFLWTIHPPAARFQHMDDAGDTPSVVNSARIRLVLGMDGSIAVHCSSLSQHNLLIQTSAHITSKANHDL